MEEPKVDRWMLDAASEIEPNDSPVAFEREFGQERIDTIARIIGYPENSVGSLT